MKQEKDGTANREAAVRVFLEEHELLADCLSFQMLVKVIVRADAMPEKPLMQICALVAAEENCSAQDIYRSIRSAVLSAWECCALDSRMNPEEFVTYAVNWLRNAPDTYWT